MTLDSVFQELRSKFQPLCERKVERGWETDCFMLNECQNGLGFWIEVFCCDAAGDQHGFTALLLRDVTNLFELAMPETVVPMNLIYGQMGPEVDRVNVSYLKDTWPIFSVFQLDHIAKKLGVTFCRLTAEEFNNDTPEPV